jgi:conjugal transfer/entry exclusion protein
MSVHQKSLDISNSMEHKEAAPELEYRAVSHDSLSMFLAAIGGAVLGMLLTLLVLAIINGGTLSFTGGERLTVFEEKLARVDKNVDSVSHNVDTVSEQANVIQNQLGIVENALRAEMGKQNANIGNLDKAVETLDTTRQQFNTLITALSSAMQEMNVPAATPVPAK